MKTLKIGNIELPNLCVLAPMAGVTDLPFRLLCREQGAGLLCMEMVSAKAISYHNKNTIALLKIAPGENPVALQLFGSEPELMAEVAASIEDLPFDILDINMGCPVPKIVNNGEGSALMKDPALAGKIVESITKAIKKPVTVKIRKGFTEDSVNAVEMAKRLEASGAAAIAVHGRTREQYYSGKADWEIISQVKEAVSVPVIGNGDVDSPEKAKALLDETGCDGIMIGRAAEGDPWIFKRVNHYLETGELLPLPTREERREMILRHAKMQLDEKGIRRGCPIRRDSVAWWERSVPTMIWKSCWKNTCKRAKKGWNNALSRRIES